MSDTQNELTSSLARALAGESRSDFIANLLALHAHLLASQINLQHFKAIECRNPVSTRGLNCSALSLNIGPQQRLAVIGRGRLSALLVQRLICSRRQATAVISRRHFVGFKECEAECVSTLKGHQSCFGVTSVAFHPSAPYLATGCDDYTVKLWMLNADCSVTRCVSMLQGHSGSVYSVAFHPSAPYLATGSKDNTAKLWLLNADCSAATCVSTLRGHSSSVLSVAFHPSGPYLATGSDDRTAKLWLLNADCSAATCVSTLQGHSCRVHSVAFHPSAPYLATGSMDDTAKLWC
jgi:WD40 repeat protein